MLRRRLTPLGVAAIGVASDAGASGGMHYVFSSRHGESTRTLRLLLSLARNETMSPADFSLSVHNASAGLLSISTGARSGHTAIAAGADSFAAGLIEALAQLRVAPFVPVLLVYFDEALPVPLNEIDTLSMDGLALAVLLGDPADHHDAMRVTIVPEPDALPRATTAQAEDFVRFLAGSDSFGYSPGGRMRLEWRRADA